MKNRYASQLCLPEVGETGQKALERACVVVVGAGGLGSVLLPALAGGGIGHIHIFDDDVVEEVNLHRQTLYRMSDIGKNKAECAAHYLRQLNPFISVTAHANGAQWDVMSHLVQIRLDEVKQNGGRFVVIDAADNYATTYMLSDLCRQLQLFLISASAIRWGGYGGIFCGNVPSYRAVFPICDHTMLNCETAGVLGTVVGLVGMLQAQLCFSLLLDVSPFPAGRLYRWDAKELRMSYFSFLHAEEPENNWPFLAYNQLQKDDVLIDLRKKGEQPEITDFPFHPIALERLLDSSEWDFPKESRVVLCCQSGARAMRAATHLYKLGFRKLALLAMKHQKIMS